MSFDREYWLSKLSEWRSISDFQALVNDCDKALGAFGAMIDHGTGFWRDAWIAQSYASKVAASEVRLLHPVPYPDFAARWPDGEKMFEATEAMRPSRRRGDEYRKINELLKNGLSTVTGDPEENWLTCGLANQILRKASENKASKPYANTCGLVIYLNESEYRTARDEIVGTFVESTRSSGEAYQSVDILWSGQIWHVWSQGQPLGLVQ